MIQLFTQNQVQPYINDLAQLRMRIFREYPYLYDGNLAYEQVYLKKFTSTPNSIICIAFSENKIVGALSGLPLAHETPAMRAPWDRLNQSTQAIYYFSEALLLPQARGKGLGVQLFEMAEKWVQESSHYHTITFATIVREENHPKKPADYIDLERFWMKRGYTKNSDKACTLAWLEVDELHETEKKLLFWTKTLA